jgi:hypothetical protein
VNAKQIPASILLAIAVVIGTAQQSNPFLGRWDFNISLPQGGHAASWLGVYNEHGPIEVWFQPTGGNVIQIQDFKIDGSQLKFSFTGHSGVATWELDAFDGKLTGFQQRGDQKIPITGTRAPEINHDTPREWTKAEPLFNGKNLAGWEPIDDVTHNNWSVKDGLLVNTARGANLKSLRTFDDFKLHFEVRCPDQGNSGFYLRGRYEVQIEYQGSPPERAMASIYGRIAPVPTPPRTPGEWEVFDVTLVGRRVTVMHNGVTVIDNHEIEGITGGALDANEGEPGPFYIQGDHTGGLQFRNITVSLPR